jgi:hypothetical protein
MLAERFAHQLLSGPPAPSAAAVAERLLAVQGQDPRGFRLAVRARTRGLVAADVDAALNDGSLLVSWLNRGTLHLVRAEDYWLLQPLTTPQLLAGNARRLAQEGVPPAAAERGVAAVERALASDGPLTRAALRARVAAADDRVEGQALVHVLFLASLRGLIVRGPVVGGEQAFVLVRDWLGRAPPPVERDVGLAEVARRYLAGHGPASDRDLARWAGLTLGDARRGLAALRLVDWGDARGSDVDGSDARGSDVDGSDARRSDARRPDVDRGDARGGDARRSDVDGGDARGRDARGSPASRGDARVALGDRLVSLRPPPRHPVPLPPPRLLGAFEPFLLGWASREQVVGADDTTVAVNGLFRPFALVEGAAVGTWSLSRGRVALAPFRPLSDADAAALAEDAADVERFLRPAPATSP